MNTIKILGIKHRIIILAFIWIILIISFISLWQPLIIYVHEHGHAYYAISKGVLYSELTWVVVNGRPGVQVPSNFPKEYLPYFRYAGGFIAGLFSLVIYLGLLIVLYLIYCKQKSDRNWSIIPAVILVSLIFGWVIKEFVNGYYEGAQNELYQLGYKQLPIMNSFTLGTFIHCLLSFGYLKLKYFKNKKCYLK
jgi:hypothetical protein